MLGRKLANATIATAKEKELETQNAAATKIQCMVRKHIARAVMKARARRIWQRIFDPKFKIYFWHNRLNAQSQWTVPKYVPLYTDADSHAAIKIENIVRGFLARMRTKKRAAQKYTRFYDSNLNRFYWMVNETQKTTWKASAWLIKQEIPLPPEDEMLYKSVQKIKELEAKLAEKENEIKEVRKKRYEELEPEVLQDRVANAKSLQRSKNMDEWTVDELAAWFTEMKLAQHIPFLYANR